MTGRDRTVVIVVAVLAAIAASWMLVISPKRDQASQLQTQIDKTQSSLSDAQAALAQGEAARTAFRRSYTTLVRLGEAVPTDDNVPSLIYEIQSAASATGVDFRGLTLDPAGPGGPVSASPSTGSTPTTAAPSTTSPAPATGATGATGSTTVLPPGAGIGPAGFPVEPFTFSFQGNFFHLANFFGRLQRFVTAVNSHLSVSGRLLSLEAIDLTPSPDGFPQIEASVSATTYLLPAGEGLLAGASAAGPAPPPATQPASTPTASSPAPAAVVAPVSAK